MLVSGLADSCVVCLFWLVDCSFGWLVGWLDCKPWLEDGSQPKMDPFNFVWILIKETDRSTFSIVNFSENNHENIWCIKEAGVCV